MLAVLVTHLHPRWVMAQAGEPTSGPQWQAVDAALGRAGQSQPGGVRKYGFPRSDLSVTVDGVRLLPAFALGSWAGFAGSGAGALAMGDMVVSDRELSPVLAQLEGGGLQVTAVHNHLLRESPRIMYLHFEGRGDPVRVAAVIHRALALTGTPAAGPAGPGAPFPLDTARLARALGRRGKVNGGVYQVSVPRSDTVRVHGMPIPPAMGVATAINVQPTGRGAAAVTGDLVLRAEEVNPVIRELSAAGIEVTALHGHMLVEEPRLFFMHFWARGDALALAGGLRKALERTR